NRIQDRSPYTVTSRMARVKRGNENVLPMDGIRIAQQPYREVAVSGLAFHTSYPNESAGTAQSGSIGMFVSTLLPDTINACYKIFILNLEFPKHDFTIAN